MVCGFESRSSHHLLHRFDTTHRPTLGRPTRPRVGACRRIHFRRTSICLVASGVFPYFPAFALGAALVSLGAMVYYNREVAIVFALFVVLGYGYFLTTRRRRASAPIDSLIEE